MEKIQMKGISIEKIDKSNKPKKPKTKKEKLELIDFGIKCNQHILDGGNQEVVDRESVLKKIDELLEERFSITNGK